MKNRKNYILIKKVVAIFAKKFNNIVMKKALKFKELRIAQSSIFEDISDNRQKGKVVHTIHDTLMSSFAMFYFRDPSVLFFQKKMENRKKKNNLRNLFGVETIPKETQMKEIIDEIPSWKLFPAFKEIYKRLQRSKGLKKFEFLKNNYLFNIDGSQYFTSEKIKCPSCLIKESSKNKEKIKYYHLILQGTIVHPDMNQVIPFAPEEISNNDGTEKQDCEINASIRMLKRIKKDHPKLSLTINGDGLYSNNTIIREIKSLKNYHFILVAKPGNHKFLFELVDAFKKNGGMKKLQIIKKKKNGKSQTFDYAWRNNIPLNGRKNSEYINYFEYTLTNEEGKKTRHNSWVTDIEINEKNIDKMVAGGRSRWKIENEVFNILKNQGYHVEHNFGHGTKNLSFNFFLLNLLAFTWHQILELNDKNYINLRSRFSKQFIWEDIRVLFRKLLYNDWDDILEEILIDYGIT